MKNEQDNESMLNEGLIKNTAERIKNRILSGAGKFETNQEMQDRKEEEAEIDRAEEEENKKAKLKEHYKNRLNEVYRLTPARREVLSRIEKKADDQMDIFLDAPQGHEAYNKAMLGAAQGTRTELMRQMALPQDRRTGAWAGASDEELKKTMIGARRTQKNIEGLLRKNEKRRRLKESVEHYKGILNEMIPNAERFGSRMGLARHQAARVKKVIDAHNADVDAKSFKSHGQPEFPTWHQKDVTDRAKRIQSIAQAHGAVISAQGTPEMRTTSMNYSNGGIIHPSEVKLAQLDSKNKPMSTVDFSVLGDANRRIGQDNADKLRTAGLVDRRKKAAQAAKDAERQKIKNAFTFEQ
jgi:hypothetical protein